MTPTTPTLSIVTHDDGEPIVRFDIPDDPDEGQHMALNGPLLLPVASAVQVVDRESLVSAVEPLLLLRDGPGDIERPDGAICWDESGPGGGAWIVLGTDVPDGWRWWMVTRSVDESQRPGLHDSLYWTLPPTKPTTERVPWWEAFNSGAHVVGLGGRIESVCRVWGQVRLRGADGQRVPVAPDGTVEVVVGTEVGDQ